MIYDIQSDFRNYIDGLRRHDTLQNNLRASSIGFECDRKHYYDLTERRKAPSIELQSIWEEGKHLEKFTEKQLIEMGYELNDRQREHRLENPLITAHIEGKLRKGDGPWWPYDVKSCNPWDFPKLTSAEDFILSKKPHQRNYATQILIYMLGTESEYGCLIMKDKQTGQVRDVWFSFNEHISLLDEAIKRAQRVYAAREAKQAPERTENRDLCSRCDWASVCLPDLINNGGVDFIESEELAEHLKRRADLKELAAEYEEIDDKIKSTVKQYGTGEKVCGNWLMTVKQRSVKKKVPLTWTEQENSYLVVNIAKIGEK